MNILFLDQYSDLGGAQRCLIDLVPAVIARGWRAQVAAPGNGAMRERVQALGATYHEIHCGPYESGGKSIANLLRFPVELPKLTREIASLGGDIVYVNGPRLMPAAALASSRIVFHCHSRLKHRYDAALVGIALAQATLIASCRYVAEPLRPYVDRFDVVYNGVEGPKIPKSGSKIGVIGRIGIEKGQLEFVEMARLLPNEQFVICGAPLFSNPVAMAYYERVKSAAAGLPIEFTGWREDIGEVLSQLALLIVPSAPGEATTRVILEAYAAGVPVIATRSGGIPEIVEDGVTGYLVADADPKKLAAKVEEVNPRVAENAYEAWKTRYTVEQYQTRILSILESARA
jgi:glycosyltransferase involved in cell wall biosynthesis